MFVLRVSNDNVTILFFLFFFFCFLSFFCLSLINCLDLKEGSIKDPGFFFFGFVEDLWFDDVIYGFWVDYWVFYRVC